MPGFKMEPFKLNLRHYAVAELLRKCRRGRAGVADTTAAAAGADAKKTTANRKTKTPPRLGGASRTLLTHSLKATGFKPIPLNVNPGVKRWLFTVNLRRYASGDVRDGAQGELRADRRGPPRTRL
jgi:hypothetical protein